MGLFLKATRTAGDGTELCLVVDEQDKKYLFEPLSMTLSPKDKIFLELLRELRQIIRTPLGLETDLVVFSYQKFEKCAEQTGLLLAYNEDLWTHWPEKGRAVLPPPTVAAVAQGLLKMVPTAEEQVRGFPGFYPGDLVPLGDGRWGLLDPRVQHFLAPYRMEGDRRALYMAPEVIAGSPPTEASCLYTLGLTLFQLATGEFPFPLNDHKETVTAMLREDPPDPRYDRPQIGQGLADLILKLLSRKPQKRPDVQSCATALQQAREAGTLEAGAEEITRFQAEAALVKEKTVRKRQRYWRWQRYKWPLAAAIGVLLFVFFLIGGSGYEDKITPATPPLAVVKVFYDGLARLDPVQLEEPLQKGVGSEFTEMVSFLHVTSKIRQAYELIDEPFLQLEGLTITEAEESSASTPVFVARYNLRIRQGEDWVSQERRDRLNLEKKKKEWRISGLNSVVLDEVRMPANTSKPAGSLDRSNGVR